MEDKKAAEILKAMLKKYPFTMDEKTAVENVIGILFWTALGKSRTQAKKAKREKSAKW